VFSASPETIRREPGYGDFAPKHVVARMCVMVEVAFGLMLIVFAVGAYFACKEALDDPKN